MTVKTSSKIDEMHSAGAHFGYTRTRRHPSVKPYVLGTKNRVDILNLEKIEEGLDKAKEFVKSLASTGKVIIFVGAKPEARDAIKKAAEELGQPYVIERWIGGTLTNFPEIKKRIDKLAKLLEEREKGATDVYTKKERLLIDREIARLEKYFAGLASLKNIPAAVFVVDSKKEHIAVKEAKLMKVPVISISSSDCDLKQVTYPIVGNDSSLSSVAFFVSEIVESYKEGIKANSQTAE
ncbi:MAG: 30S ribosomal protein S2 [Candidatus Paceibacterota bacterium]|jgi:small subunit ribosomal protein S2